MSLCFVLCIIFLMKYKEAVERITYHRSHCWTIFPSNRSMWMSHVRSTLCFHLKLICSLTRSSSKVASPSFRFFPEENERTFITQIQAIKKPKEWYIFKPYLPQSVFDALMALAFPSSCFLPHSFPREAPRGHGERTNGRVYHMTQEKVRIDLEVVAITGHESYYQWRHDD